MHLPDLGRRGEGWVLLQAGLLAAIPLVGLIAPSWPERLTVPALVVGAVLALAGVGLVLAGFRGLGDSLSVFPEPLQAASLITTGVYARARHPIYGGVILIALGLATAMSPWAVPLVALLALVLRGKSSVEERRLATHFHGYTEYCQRVPRRFFPLW